MGRWRHDKLLEAASAELKAEARRERKRALARLWERLEAIHKKTDRLTKVVVGVTALGGALTGVWHSWPVQKLVELYRARDVGAAELPRTGVASTADDYVKTPRKR